MTEPTNEELANKLDIFARFWIDDVDDICTTMLAAQRLREADSDRAVGVILRETYLADNPPECGACDCEWCITYHEVTKRIKHYGVTP